MWSYYGRKTKIIDLYPPPSYGVIVEPFAGTATYSLYRDNWKRDVILGDAYEVIARIWQYLQQAKPSDVLALPDMAPGQKVPSSLCDEERWLIGFCINAGSSVPKKTASRYNHWNEMKPIIAGDLHKIRHWVIQHCSYDQIVLDEATWFIDPPYQGQAGSHYKYNKIDFPALGEWCRSRKGESIVCENIGADWLPFEPLAKHKGGMNRDTVEAVWLQGVPIVQQRLFDLQAYKGI